MCPSSLSYTGSLFKQLPIIKPIYIHLKLEHAHQAHTAAAVFCNKYRLLFIAAIQKKSSYR